MKNVFTGVLILNLIVEFGAAFALISASLGGVGVEDPMSATVWSRSYGFGALAIGSAVIWIWPHRDNYAVVSTVLGMLMVFHIGVTISFGVVGGQLAVGGLHAVLSVLMVTMYVLRGKWCEKPAG
ncbi:MAG: hypothetical protein E2O92_00710 [Alphaproteobacteria bacterium]|nr:MAG: hypothetical protein E2O92_00710 [Alphaproteobacteria bacterium]